MKMTDSTTSKVAELQAEVAALKTELACRTDEVTRWENAFQLAFKDRMPHSATSPLSFALVPSYLKGTMASHWIYENGSLINSGRPQQRYTISTASGAELSHIFQWAAFPVKDKTPVAPKFDWDETPIEPSAPSSCSRCIDIQGQPFLLAEWTRLNEHGFYDELTSKVIVPFDLGKDLMSEALRLAQEAVFDDIQKYDPVKQRELYLEGPRSVQLGRDELSRAYSCDPASDCRGVYHLPKSIMEVINLRNTVCHQQSNLTNKEIDGLLRHAQAFVVDVNDKLRATRIRELRDTLEAATRRIRRDRKGCGFTCFSVREQGTLAMHHQKLFVHVMRKVKEDETNEGMETTPACAEAVVRAARGWALEYQKPGELRDCPVAQETEGSDVDLEQASGLSATVCAMAASACTEEPERCDSAVGIVGEMYA